MNSNKDDKGYFKFESIYSIDTFHSAKKNIKIILLALVIIGFFLRLFYLFELTCNPFNITCSFSDIFDQFRFVSLTNEILENHWLGKFVYKYSPVYSYFIAFIYKIFGSNLFHVYLIQIIFGTFAIYIIYKSVYLLFDNKIIGIIAATILTFYGPLVFHEGTLLRASSIAYLNLLGFYFLLIAFKKERPSFFLFSGIILGISLILRPNVLSFIIIPYILFSTRKSFKFKIIYTLLFIIGNIIVVSPIAIRNRLLQKNALISYQGPSTFWIGNTHDTSGVGLYRSPLRVKFADEANGSIIKTIKILIREIKLHPDKYKDLYSRKIIMFFNGYEVPANLSYDHFREMSFFLQLCFFNFTIISPLAILGFILSLDKYRHLHLMNLILLTLSISVILFHIQGRYRIPSIPFFIILSSYAIYWLWYVCFSVNDYSMFRISLALLFLLILFTRPVEKNINKFMGSRIRTSDYSNMSLSYFFEYKYGSDNMSEDKKEAILKKAIYNELKAIKTVSNKETEYKTNCFVNLGRLYELANQNDNAVAAYKNAISLYPGSKEEIIYLIRQGEIKFKGIDTDKITFKDSEQFRNYFPKFIQQLFSCK